jgi:hypothetical protein
MILARSVGCVKLIRAVEGTDNAPARIRNVSFLIVHTLAFQLMLSVPVSAYWNVEQAYAPDPRLDVSLVDADGDVRIAPRLDMPNPFPLKVPVDPVPVVSDTAPVPHATLPVRRFVHPVTEDAPPMIKDPVPV